MVRAAAARSLSHTGGRADPGRQQEFGSSRVPAMQNEAPPRWPWEAPFGSRVAAWVRSSAPAEEPDLLALSAGLTGTARQRGIAFVRLLVVARRNASHPWHRLLQAGSDNAGQLVSATAQAYDMLCDDSAASGQPSAQVPAGGPAAAAGAGTGAAHGATAVCTDGESLEQFERVVARMENLSHMGFRVVTGMSKQCFVALLGQLGPSMGVTAGDAASADAAAAHLKVVLLFLRNGEPLLRAGWV